MPVYLWQKLPAPNATADNTINLQAGRSPSAITPADRATLAAIAQWRDDLAGSLVTTGNVKAYELDANSVCSISVTASEWAGALLRAPCKQHAKARRTSR